MSIFSVQGKGWRYHFRYKGIRYTKAWFKTKTEARQAMVEHQNELKNPRPQTMTPTDITFIDLVNKRLDYVQVYNTERHYKDYRYMARRWVKNWGNLLCSQITRDMVQQFIIKRSRSSSDTGNKEIRYLRATFNYGKKEGYVATNPADGIDFLPVEKSLKYIPPKEDVLKVILAADPDVQDYLWVIKETLGRMSEVNQLTWEDVDLQNQSVTLYTRKKRGGHKTPRKIPMTKKLYEVLFRRYRERRKDMPWVFWQTYWSNKTGEKKEGPYIDRRRIMNTLCKKVGVKYFRFHALRHFGASVMDHANVPKGSIQRILGHERRETTEIYLHSIGESEREAIRIMEEALRSGESTKCAHDTEISKCAHECAHKKTGSLD